MGNSGWVYELFLCKKPQLWPLILGPYLPLFWFWDPHLKALGPIFMALTQ